MDKRKNHGQFLDNFWHRMIKISNFNIFGNSSENLDIDEIKFGDIMKVTGFFIIKTNPIRGRG